MPWKLLIAVAFGFSFKKNDFRAVLAISNHLLSYPFFIRNKSHQIIIFFVVKTWDLADVHIYLR